MNALEMKELNLSYLGSSIPIYTASQISSNWAGYFLDPYSFYSSVISISYLSVQGDLASTAGTVPSPPSCQAPPQNPMGFAVLQHQLSDHRVINLLQHFLP